MDTGKVKQIDARGIVAAARKEAIDGGNAIFAKGGNAVDAAIAAAFAAGVAEPFMSGIGGVGEIVLGLPDGRVHVIDCAARAPLAASERMFVVVGEATGLYAWPAVRDDGNVYGALAVTAPRMVQGLSLLHEKFGRLAWAELFAPAIALARNGVIADHFTSAILAHERPTLSRDPLAAQLYYPGGYPLTASIDGNPIQQVPNPALTEALELIAEKKALAFQPYGEIAAAVVEAVRDAGGILTHDDFAQAPTILADVAPKVNFAGWKIYGSPLPSGAMTAAEIMGALSRKPAARSAAAPERYTDFANAAEDAFKVRLADYSGEGVRGGPATATTHLSVAGLDGTVVSITLTLLSLYGSQFGLPSHGFFLNNGMMWFDPVPGKPNSVRGGARALMAVSPIVAFDQHSRRALAVGALGARRIITAVSQILENRLRYGDVPHRAVNRPRIHADGLGPVQLDHRLSDEVLTALEGRGPTMRVYHGPTTLASARAFMAEVDVEQSTLSAGIDERSMSVWDLSGGCFDD